MNDRRLAPPAAGASGQAATDRPVATIKKNAREQLRVALTEYRGHRLIDVRVYAPNAAGDTMVPTKAGVTFKAGLLPDVLVALQKALQEARAAGWIDAAR